MVVSWCQVTYQLLSGVLSKKIALVRRRAGFIRLKIRTSFSLKINNQTQAGIGIAYSIVDKKNSYISVSDGVLYDVGNLTVDTTHYSYNTYRNSLRLLFHFNVKDIFLFDANGYLQNSFQQGTDYIIKTNTTLTIKVRKWLGFTTSVSYNRMNITESENLLFTYGLTIDKYF